MDRPGVSETTKTAVVKIACEELIAFFDSRGMIHIEFVPPGQTVNVDFYKRVLDQLLKRISRMRPDLHAYKAWCLLHDNAPSHNPLLIRQF